MAENSQEIDLYALAREMGTEQHGKGQSKGLPDTDGLQKQLVQLTEKYDQLY